MKFRFMSDLHLEFPGNRGLLDKSLYPNSQNETIILAGDIVLGHARDQIEFYTSIFKDVIFVLGNHEFYKNDFDDINQYWEQVGNEIPNLHVLNNGVIEIDGVRIIGSILWSDLGNPIDAIAVRNQINDFYVIKKDGSRITTEFITAKHKEHVRFLKAELTKSYKGKTLVVTHYAPLEQTVASQFKNSPINPAYYSDLSDMFSKYEFDAWIYGHNHSSMDFMFEGKRVVSNQFGYPHQRDPNFDFEKVIAL